MAGTPDLLRGATLLNALQRPWPAAALSAIQMLALLILLAYLGGSVMSVSEGGITRVDRRIEYELTWVMARRASGPAVVQEGSI